MNWTSAVSSIAFGLAGIILMYIAEVNPLAILGIILIIASSHIWIID